MSETAKRKIVVSGSVSVVTDFSPGASPTDVGDAESVQAANSMAINSVAQTSFLLIFSPQKFHLLPDFF
jgi:hypothetical protein